MGLLCLKDCTPPCSGTAVRGQTGARVLPRTRRRAPRQERSETQPGISTRRCRRRGADLGREWARGGQHLQRGPSLQRWGQDCETRRGHGGRRRAGLPFAGPRPGGTSSSSKPKDRAPTLVRRQQQGGLHVIRETVIATLHGADGLDLGRLNRERVVPGWRFSKSETEMSDGPGGQ